MPDATPPPFRLPVPLQPPTHHAIGLHNAPIFEYDLLEFTGEGGRPVIVIEPRRADGAVQVPFAWFASKVGGSIVDLFGGRALVIAHTVTGGAECWALLRQIPVIDPADPKVQAIQAQAKEAGIPAEVALQHAVAIGALEPSETRITFAELKPEVTTEVLTELFSHHVAPDAKVTGTAPIGFAAQATRMDRQNAVPTTTPAQPVRTGHRTGHRTGERSGQRSGHRTGLAA